MPRPIEILSQYWGYEAFRPVQEEVIRSVLDGADTLALLPTGGGKSICFQVPGLSFQGLTIVISPLIALMKDQVSNLNQRGIAATYINSTMSYKEIDRKLEQAMKGKYKFLYLAPERLRTELLKERVGRMNVSLLAVDEAHCISQWGYDFRPAYLEIAEFRKLIPGVPVIALTATATTRVKEDILESLEMKTPAVFVKSFKRDNLAYLVFDTEDVFGKIRALLDQNPGSGIIYVRTRKATQLVADKLALQGISAKAYHGGLSHKDRTRIQDDWINNKTRIIVATNAFGMGIDKPDVRIVIHYHLPVDIESYYQEAGRAGRDGKPAIAVAFQQPKDLAELYRWVMGQYPDFDTVNGVYWELCDFFQVPNSGIDEQPRPFDIAVFSKKAGLPVLKSYQSVKILDKEGVITLQERPEEYASVMILGSGESVMQYKEKFPEYAPLIDLMLRTLGGKLFSEPHRFLPAFWTRRLGISEVEIDRMLHQMQERGLIHYRPALKKPSLVFHSYRRDLSRTELSWHKYNFLADQSQKRLKAIIGYVKNGRKCRSRVLQEYFGEKTKSNCGICDVCLNKNSSKEVKDTEWHEVIKNTLSDGPVSFKFALEQLPGTDDELKKDFLRKLADTKQVEISGTQLKWLERKQKR